MVASSAVRAFRATATAGLRARAVPAPLYTRPSIYYRRTAQVHDSLRYSTDAKPDAVAKGTEGAAGKGEGEAAPKETANAPREVKEAPKEEPKAREPPAPKAPKKSGRSRKFLGTSLLVGLVVGYVYGSDTRASAHRYALVPLIRLLYPDAEDAHHLGVDMLKCLYGYGLHPRERGNPDGDGKLATEVRLLPCLLYKNKFCYGVF